MKTLLASYALAAALASAATVTFSNTTPISIPDGNANPYPSNITLSGMGSITGISVSLNGVTHTFAGDIDILLVGPTGATLMFLSDEGGSNDFSASNLLFQDSGGALLASGGIIPSGTYAPINLGTCGSNDSFSSPAPAGPHNSPAGNNCGTATLMSVFGGTNPNGTWSLFIADDATGDVGEAANGWSITLTDDGQVPEPSTFALMGLGGLATALAARRRR